MSETIIPAVTKPGFSWITPVLWVNDLVVSLEHYEKVLGFDRTWQWSEEKAFDEPARPSFACISRGEISLFLSEKAQGHSGTWLCLNVRMREELATLFEEYKASGATILEEPRDRSWGMREMVVQDPDGNTFRIGLPTVEEVAECGEPV